MWRRALRVDTIAAVAVPIACGALLIEGSLRTSHRDAEASELCAFAETSHLVTDAKVRTLERDGFVCIPVALDAEQVAHARADARAIHASGRLDVSGNHATVRQDRIAMIRETDGTRAAGRAERGCAPLGPGLVHALRLARGVSHALELHAYSGTAGKSLRVPRQVQLSSYPADGGASYGRHADACTDSLQELGLLEWLRLRDYRERVVSVVLYLNSPAWGAQATEGFGGELRCFHPADGAYSDISPRGGTLVIFDSRAVEHEVRPSGGAERYALTSWIVSSATDS